MRGQSCVAIDGPLRVLVADHDAASREAVRAGLERAGLCVCAAVDDAGTAVVRAVDERPDVAIVDVDLTGGGIHATARMVERLPALPVVVVSRSPSEPGLFAALRAGARGYLPADTEPAGLSAALRGVAGGEAAIPRRLVLSLAEEVRRRRGPRHVALPSGTAVLTAREADVLDLLCEERGTAEIARRMFVSQATVRTHIAAVVAKLGVSDRHAAVRLIRTG